MSTPDPTCTVNASTTPVDVSASSTITIALASPAGARFWSVACSSTDELSSTATINATIAINQTNKTATATLPGTLGTAYIFTSTVGILGLGLDANGIQQDALSTTFKVNVKASNGARVLAEDETFEQNPAAGWVAVINPLLRAGASIPTTVGGTGFPHVTSGSFDANARAVNLASNGAGGDVTGVLPWANGGRLQGILHVVNGTPGVLSNVVQVAMCESNTGTTSVSIPTAAQFGGAIPDDFSFLVADTGGAAATSNITVTNAGAVGIVDPNTGAKVTTSVTIKTNYGSAYWTWDATESVFFIANGGLSTATSLVIQNNGSSITQRGILDLNGFVYVDDSGGGRMRFFATSGSPSTGSSFTVSTAAPWGEIVAGGTYTMPASPILGQEITLVAVSGTFESNPCTFVGNGSNICDPNNTYVTAASVTGRRSNVTYRFRHNGSLYRCTGVS